MIETKNINYIHYSQSEIIFASLHQNEILANRKWLIEKSNSFPFPLGKVLQEHYNSRMNRAGVTPMLGEYAPYLIGDLFSIQNQVVDCFSRSWILLYEYSLLLDDLLDEKNESTWKYELLLSQVIFESFLTEIVTHYDDKKLILDLLSQYRKESVLSMIHEMNCSESRFNKPIDPVIIIQGGKLSLVKLLASCMLLMDRGRPLSMKEDCCIGHISAGIQLLDDLADAIEDHIAGRMNTTLKNAYQWLSKINSKNTKFNSNAIGINQFLVGLIFSHSIDNTWNLASHQLDQGLDLVCKKESNSYIYFNSISEKCKKASVELRELILSEPLLEKKLSQAVNQGEIQTLSVLGSLESPTFELLSKYINKGPRASN